MLAVSKLFELQFASCWLTLKLKPVELVATCTLIFIAIFLSLSQHTHTQQEDSEWRRVYLGYTSLPHNVTTKKMFVPTPSHFPTEMDWRVNNAVAPVKNQVRERNIDITNVN